MKVISDKITMAVATSLHSFDLLPATTFEGMQEKLSEEAIGKRYRNDYVFHAKVCSITASVLLAVGDEIATLTQQRNLAVEALKEMLEYAGIIEERCDSIATTKARAAIKESEK